MSNLEKYLDFDLEIARAAGKKYRAQVLDSSAGQATAEFRLPFSEVKLENFLLRMGHTRGVARRLESPEMEAAKTFGGHLFDAVFAGDVRACLRSSLDEADRQGKGLRLRLRLTEAPDLADIPWEYLYNTGVNRFLALSAETPLVRYLDLPERIQPLAVKPPLRILVMISSPSDDDYPALDVETEWTRVRDALKNLTDKGTVTVDRLEQATLAALQRQLRQTQYHVFHFIGHGGFDQMAQDGVLLLEGETGKGRQVSGNYLGTLLHDERTLRLAVLNACEGARTSRTDPFAGVAQSLVQQGIPAVIAMQFAISDTAAITFATEFYTAIADPRPDHRYPVDAALAEARKAIFAQGNDVEWGTPVLYMRSPDGCLFDMEQIGVEESRRLQQVMALSDEAQTAMDKGDWTMAGAKWQAVLDLDPENIQARAQLDQSRRQQELTTLRRESEAARARADWPTAIEKLEGLLHLDPANAEASAQLSQARQQQELTARKAERKAKTAPEPVQTKKASPPRQEPPAQDSEKRVAGQHPTPPPIMDYLTKRLTKDKGFALAVPTQFPGLTSVKDLDFVGTKEFWGSIRVIGLVNGDDLGKESITDICGRFRSFIQSLPAPFGYYPVGVLYFVYGDGCPEPLAKFILQQKHFDLLAQKGQEIFWILDVRNIRVHTHTGLPFLAGGLTGTPEKDYLEDLLSKYLR